MTLAYSQPIDVWIITLTLGQLEYLTILGVRSCLVSSEQRS